MVRDRKNPLTDNVGSGVHQQNELRFLHIDMHEPYRPYMEDSIIEWKTKSWPGGQTAVKMWGRMEMILKQGYCCLITGPYFGRGLSVRRFKIIVPIFVNMDIDLDSLIQKSMDDTGNSFINIIEFLNNAEIISLTPDQLKTIRKEGFKPPREKS